MRVALGLAADNCLYPLVGYALLRGLGIAAPGRRDLRLLGLAYLVGFAALGTALSFAAEAGADPGVPTALGLGAALGAAALLLGRRLAPLPPSPPPRLGGRPGAAVALLAAVVLAVTALAALLVALRGEWDPLADYDALWFWIPRAVIVLDAHGLDPAAWRSFPHPEYPPLVPLGDALSFRFAGGAHPALLPFQRTLLGLAFLGSAFVLLDRAVARVISLPALALIATAPWFFENLGSPLPDQTLAMLLACAALALALWLREPQPAWLGLAAVLLAGASLAKLEGLFFALGLLALVGVAALVRRGRAAAPLALVALGPAAVIPWRLWLAANGLHGSSPDYPLSRLLDPGYLGASKSRLSYALHRMYAVTESMFAAVSPFGHAPSPLTRAGTVAAAVLFVGLAAFAAARLPVLVTPFAAWFLGSFAGLAAIYWIGRLGVEEYVRVSVDRVEESIVLVPATLLPLVVGLALVDLRSGPPLEARASGEAAGRGAAPG